MEKGGNERWKRFWAVGADGDGGGEGKGQKWKTLPGELRAFEEVYGSERGEEYRERLSCEVEGREFTGVPKTEKRGVVHGEVRPAEEGGRTQKERNEDFFARKGDENAGRRDDVPPSQGGKYAGFGSQGAAGTTTGKDNGAGEGGIPGVDEFQKDPVAALTKGFGWFTTTVGKGAKSVNDGWVKPNVQKVGDFLSLLLSLRYHTPHPTSFEPSKHRCL